MKIKTITFAGFGLGSDLPQIKVKLKEVENKLLNAKGDAELIKKEADREAIDKTTNIKVELTQDLYDKINKLGSRPEEIEGSVSLKSWDYDKNEFLDIIANIAHHDNDIKNNNSTYYKIISKMQNIEQLKIKITNGLNIQKHHSLKKNIFAVFSQLQDLINNKIDDKEKAKLINYIKNLEDWIEGYFDVTKNIRTNISIFGFEGDMPTKNIKKYIENYNILRDSILSLVNPINQDIDKIKENLDVLKIDREKQTSIIKDAEEIKEKIGELNKIGQLNNTDELKQINEKIQKLLEEISEHFKNIFKELEYKEAILVEGYLIDKTFNNLKTEHKLRLEQINNHEQAMESLKKAHNNEKAALEQTNKETIDNLETENTKLQTEKADLETENTKLQTEKADLETENQNLEELNNQLKITNEINEKEKEENANLIKTKNNEIKTKNDEIEKLKSELQPKIEDTSPTAVEDKNLSEQKEQEDEEAAATKEGDAAATKEGDTAATKEGDAVAEEEAGQESENTGTTASPDQGEAAAEDAAPAAEETAKAAPEEKTAAEAKAEEDAKAAAPAAPPGAAPPGAESVPESPALEVPGAEPVEEEDEEEVVDI